MLASSVVGRSLRRRWLLDSKPYGIERVAAGGAPSNRSITLPPASRAGTGRTRPPVSDSPGDDCKEEAQHRQVADRFITTNQPKVT